MKIVNLYEPFWNAFVENKKKDLRAGFKAVPEMEHMRKMAEEWGIDLENVLRWMKSEQYERSQNLAREFVKQSKSVVKKIEDLFGAELHGEVWLSPSLMTFDGFARYDRGSHTVWFGIDHPDADLGYLKALMAHELSHVFRDHQPEVWGFLGKSLKEVSRKEYLEAMTAHEHLISEGLATVFSQVAYPEIPLHVHHFYEPQELEWCVQNFKKIDEAIKNCLSSDQEVWGFYEEDHVAHGSPSRTQYFWSAKKISDWLSKSGNFTKSVVESHKLPTMKFEIF